MKAGAGDLASGWLLRPAREGPLRRRGPATLPSGCLAEGRGYIARIAARRRGGRVAEGARLESVYTGNRIVGSNPTPSASVHKTDSLAPRANGQKADVLDSN